MISLRPIFTKKHLTACLERTEVIATIVRATEFWTGEPDGRTVGVKVGVAVGMAVGTVIFKKI